MGIFDVFKSRKEKKLPLVAKVDLEKIHKERVENQELGEVSILAKKDYSKRLKDKIRLCYVSVESMKTADSENPFLDINYGTTCVYKLPKGMSLEDAHRVVSYIVSQNMKTYKIDAFTQDAVKYAGAKLKDFGFEKLSQSEPDFNNAYMFSEYDSSKYSYKIETNDVVKTDIPGVTDLLTIGGDQFLFMDSDLESKAYPWFRVNSKFKDIKNIYDNLGLEIDENGITRAQDKEKS